MEAAHEKRKNEGLKEGRRDEGSSRKEGRSADELQNEGDGGGRDVGELLQSYYVIMIAVFL